ncbi:MAG: hypothetical protein U0163_15565 [Gemmatimonadaceae bacterium]
MLAALGYASLDAFVDATVPESIRPVASSISVLPAPSTTCCARFAAWRTRTWSVARTSAWDIMTA